MSTEPKVYKAKISDLKTLGDANPNKGTERGVYAVERSLEKFGAMRSIAVAKDGKVLAGNHTLEAYAAAGNDDVLIVETDGKQLVVVKRTDLAGDDPRAKEYAVADNRSSELGLEWDAEQIQALIDQDINLSDWFQQDELAELLAGLESDLAGGDDPGADVDRAGELQAKWQTSRGQVWEVPSLTTLGRCHRVMCGDSTSAEDVARLMGGETWDCLVTDPPYGVDYEGGRNPESNTPRTKLANDDNPAIYSLFLGTWDKHRKPKGVAYLWFAGTMARFVYDAVYQTGYEVRAMVIWNKLDAHYGNFMAQYMQKHEPCLYCVKDGSNWYGATNEVTVWDIKQPTINEYHSTQKPVECMSRPVTNSTKRGDIVTDAFLGSGTTLIACEQTGRIGYGMEISEAYTAVVLERLSGMGLAPRLVGLDT